MTDDFQGGLRGDRVAPRTPSDGTRDASSSTDPIPLPRHLSERQTLDDLDWRMCGIIELAVRNVNVASYMEHWEGRALKAEAALAAADPILRARPQPQEGEGDTNPRVDHTQYPRNPLATAASAVAWPDDPDPDYFSNVDDSDQRAMEERGLTIHKLNRIIREKRRQIRGRDRGLMYWRRWAEARFFDGERRGGTDAEVRARIDALLTGDGTQPPSGLREDPVAPRTVTAPHAHESSSADFSSTRARPPREAWQPIGSAPKGTTVLVHDDGYIGKAMLEDDGRWLDVECGRADAYFDPAPTEWLPLPAAPAQEQEKMETANRLANEDARIFDRIAKMHGFDLPMELLAELIALFEVAHSPAAPSSGGTVPASQSEEIDAIIRKMQVGLARSAVSADNTNYSAVTLTIAETSQLLALLTPGAAR